MDEKKPTHRQHNPWHDYKSRSIYHITIVVKDRSCVLGKITGDSVENAFCELSALGHDVSRCIQAIPVIQSQKGRQIKVLAKCVMPTHIHFCLFVEESMDCPLGSIIHGFKVGCNKALRKYLSPDLGNVGMPNGKQDSATCFPSKTNAVQQHQPVDDLHAVQNFPSGADAVQRHPFMAHASKLLIEEHSLFEPDFDETILKHRGQLRHMIDYVHDNPRRKWVKEHLKEKFIPVRHIRIGENDYDAVGNLMLLGLPRFQCHVRSFWKDEERRNHQNTCVKKARSNYAIVSPFVSEHEKAVMDYCLKEGHSIIKLEANGFSNYTTCPGELFGYCMQGQVLLLVPSELPHVERKGKVSRQECVFLNERARVMCGSSST